MINLFPKNCFLGYFEIYNNEADFGVKKKGKI